MYTLYILPGACSLAAHVVLLDVGATFEIKSVAGASRPAAFLAINPRGSVPVLTQGDFVLREGLAVLTHLAETHKSPLLPASGQARAKAIEWLAFANSTLHPLYSRGFFLNRQLGDDAGQSPLYTATSEAIQKHWDDIERELQTKPYICGTDCTLADILLAVIANWSHNLKQPITFGPKTRAYFTRVTERPAFKKALTAEDVTYKVAGELVS